MFNRKSLFVVIAMIIITIQVGCSKVKGDQSISSSGGSDHNKVQNKPSLSALDVITKSQQTMLNENGYIADVQDNSQNKSGNYSSNQETTSTVTATNNPLAFHTVRKTKTSGTIDNSEMYYNDGVIYQNSNGSWSKMSSDFANTLAQRNHPLEDLKRFHSLLQAAQSANKADVVTMTKMSSGDYQVSLNTGTQDKQILMQGMKDTLTLSFTPQALQKLQVNFYKVVALIDGKTFQYKNVTTDYSYVFPTSDQSLSLTEHQTYTFRGSFNGKIEIPTDAKTASEMSMTIKK